MPIATVGIWAGHGGKDPGNVNYGVMESDVTLDLSVRVAHYIRLLSRNQYNGRPFVDAVLGRFDDRYIAPAQRGAIIGTRLCNAVISIHTNSAWKASANGAEVFVPSNDRFRFSADALTSMTVANDCLERLEACGFKRRGIKRANFAVLKNSARTGPCMLIEPGFASNKEDAERLNEKWSRETIALQIALAVLGLFPSVEVRYDLIAPAT